MQEIKLPETIDIHKAAKFLGFKGTYHLRLKAASGQIRGAFKSSNRWMFLVEELVNFARDFHKNLAYVDRNIVTKRNEEWRLVKRKAAPTITQGSRSAESECKNLLDALSSGKRSSTRKNVGKR